MTTNAETNRKQGRRPRPRPEYACYSLNEAVRHVSGCVQDLLAHGVIKLSRAQTCFRFGWVERRGRDAPGIPTGYDEWMVAFGTDTADLCELAGVDVATYFDRPNADPFLRCFGGPYRRIDSHFDPSWLTNDDGAVALLVRQARDEGNADPVTLRILADALEDAGAHPAFIDHLRSGHHTCECWAVRTLHDRVVEQEERHRVAEGREAGHGAASSSRPPRPDTPVRLPCPRCRSALKLSRDQAEAVRGKAPTVCPGCRGRLSLGRKAP